MNLATINEVIKASPAIQIQSKITHLQRRAWNVLLANAYNELPNTDIYSVSVVELARKLGFNSHNEDYLKETLEALVDCTVEWNVLGKDNKQEWGRCEFVGIRKNKRWHLHVWVCTPSPPATPQPAYIYQTQPTSAKPVH